MTSFDVTFGWPCLVHVVKHKLIKVNKNLVIKVDK